MFPSGEDEDADVTTLNTEFISRHPGNSSASRNGGKGRASNSRAETKRFS
jgi:hypothetical protein